MGQGFCQQGFFCGAASKGGSPPPALRCLPAPKDCGLAGKPCCPSNLLTPHTGFEDWARPAFCKDGSVRFEFGQRGQLTDWYKDNTGDYPCTPVAADCGSGVGKPCCPLLWRLSTNPRLDPAKEGCWARGLKCQPNVERSKSGNAPPTPGTCVAA